MGPGGTHGCSGCLVFRPRPLSCLDPFGGRYPVAARGGQALEGKPAGVRPLVLARFSSLAARTLLLLRHREGRPPWAGSGMTGGRSRRGAEAGPLPARPRQAAERRQGVAAPCVRCARAMGCGRWPGRLPFGTGLRRHATRPSHSSSYAWLCEASGVAATSRVSGEDCSAHPPSKIPRQTSWKVPEAVHHRPIPSPFAGVRRRLILRNS